VTVSLQPSFGRPPRRAVSIADAFAVALAQSRRASERPAIPNSEKLRRWSHWSGCPALDAAESIARSSGSIRQFYAFLPRQAEVPMTRKVTQSDPLIEIHRKKPRLLGNLGLTVLDLGCETVFYLDNRDSAKKGSTAALPSTNAAVLSPTAGPCLNPWPDPPPTIQLFCASGCRSTIKCWSGEFSY